MCSFALARNKKTKASNCSNQTPDRPAENKRTTPSRRAIHTRTKEPSSYRCDRNQPVGTLKKQCNQRQRSNKGTRWRVIYETWVSLRKFSLRLLGTRIPFLFHRTCSAVDNVSRHTKRPNRTANRRLLLLDRSDDTSFLIAPSVKWLTIRRMPAVKENAAESGFWMLRYRGRPRPRPRSSTYPMTVTVGFRFSLRSFWP